MLCLFFAAAVFPQDEGSAAAETPAGTDAPAPPATIPEALRRPRRGEAGRYPVDTVIGPLGAGEAGEDAYRFAGDLLRALIAGNRGAPALFGVESGTLDTILEELKAINPVSCRLGGGRKEADGAVSFLVRFIGREKGISGELYIRAEGDEPEEEIETEPAEEGETAETAGEGGPAEGAADEAGGENTARNVVWRFDDLILEEPKDRGKVEEGRFDFVPYERFF
jgi:hypothetical protein